MKVYKIEVIIVDHENMGQQEIVDELLNTKFINPILLKCEEAEIGEWTDEHPLNNDDTFQSECKKLFK